MPNILKTVLLLALPASGKSEVRRYLEHVPPSARAADFHMGLTVQLDDFPYVHLMRCADEALVRLGAPRVFFAAADRSFLDPRDWGTLIELLNDDHRDLVEGRPPAPGRSAARALLARFEEAAARVGVPERLGQLDGPTRALLEDALEREARALLDAQAQSAAAAGALEDKTLVVEFARGGAAGASLPLAPPFGYAYSLARLSSALLEDATILYIWVTPDESRRKNAARTDPDDPGSILHHGVPRPVMLNDYGVDDMAWLEGQAERPGTVTVETRGRTYHVPIARFDNRVDKTSFLRGAPEGWRPEDVRAVHDGLARAFAHLASAGR